MKHPPPNNNSFEPTVLAHQPQNPTETGHPTLSQTLEAGLTVQLFSWFKGAIFRYLCWLIDQEPAQVAGQFRPNERVLALERDRLEVMVLARTRALEQAQAEQYRQLYHFAAFGRLASGIFHDIADPLTTVSLSLEELQDQKSSDDLLRAIEATRRMQRAIESARRQIQQQEQRYWFSVSQEIEESLTILGYKLTKHHIKVTYTPITVELYGNALKFQQIITNLISNAIDAYDQSDQPSLERRVVIKTSNQTKFIEVTIQDWGVGIAETDQIKIFEPFYTTKNSDRGTGIGLSFTKEMLENDFRASIDVKSQLHHGTTFRLRLPTDLATTAVKPPATANSRANYKEKANYPEGK